MLIQILNEVRILVKSTVSEGKVTISLLNFFEKPFSKLKNILYICTLKIWQVKFCNTMKKDIHPENYRLVAFKDMSNDDVFITKSAADTRETLEVDGVEYPLVKLEISRTSHPYYTGKAKLVDTAGRIDKFKNKYKKFDKK